MKKIGMFVGVFFISACFLPMTKVFATITYEDEVAQVELPSTDDSTLEQVEDTLNVVSMENEVNDEEQAVVGRLESPAADASDVEMQENVRTKTFLWGDMTLSLTADGTLIIPGGTLVENHSLSITLGIDNSSVKKIIVADSLKLVGDMSGLFAGLINVEEIVNANLIDVSEVTNLTLFFGILPNLSTLDISLWKTSSVTSMMNLFMQATSLTSLDLSKWDTSSLTNLNGTFNNMTSLTSLNLDNWDVSAVTDMHGTFMNTSSLLDLELANWNTSSVITMSDLFAGAASLRELNLSTWKTEQVSDMSEMFIEATSLEVLNLSNWQIQATTKMNNMFSGTKQLRILTLGADFRFNEGANLPEHPAGVIIRTNGRMYQLVV